MHLFLIQLAPCKYFKLQASDYNILLAFLHLEIELGSILECSSELQSGYFYHLHQLQTHIISYQVS